MKGKAVSGVARARKQGVPSPNERHPTPHMLETSQGFTLLEMMIVLFLLGGVLALVIPRIVVGEDLRSTGRKFISALRDLQSLAVTGQKSVKLYFDLDRGTYWAMMVDGTEEKIPLDATWAVPRTLPEMIRFVDISVGQTKRLSGRMDLSIFPNGRIDPVIVHFGDGSNNVLAIAVESFTGAIRTSDERIEPPRNLTIPDRIRSLLQATQGATAAFPGIKS